jgi:hypothetical protein
VHESLESASEIWKGTAGPVLRGLLPYPDHRRRRLIRKTARRLVVCEPWPGNDCTPLDVAELCILRALWLQRETHRTARSRHGEALALLTRTAVENCIVGLYCLHSDDPVDEFRAANAEAIHRMLGNIGFGEILTPEVLAAIDVEIGGAGSLPSVRKMAERVSQAIGDPLVTNLYWRVYVPVSTFFVHANGVTLLRHVSSSGKLLDEPEFPWARRCALRTADGCMGLLALAVAARKKEPQNDLAVYAQAHMDRALAPLAIMSGKSFGRALGPKNLFKLVGGLLKMRTWVRSGQSETEPWDVRSKRVRDWFSTYADASGAPESIRSVYLERLVIAIAGPQPASVEPSADQEATGGSPEASRDSFEARPSAT